MKKINKIAVILILITFIALFTACATKDKATLEELNPAVFEHPSGYSIALPADWQIYNPDYGNAYAVSNNNDVVINIFPEIGGMDYHSLDDQQQIIGDMLGEFMTEVKQVKQMNFGLGSDGCHILFCGTNDNGQKWNTEAVYLAPFNGIHYYLFLSAPAKLYDDYSGLFAQISESFKITFTEDQAYAMFNLEEDEFATKMTDGLHLQVNAPVNSLLNKKENTQENT